MILRLSRRTDIPALNLESRYICNVLILFNFNKVNVVNQRLLVSIETERRSLY